ncbi:hypothetical protein [Proteiniphilum sp.]|uniref:hypothetical protein n=1 Tax=Proteiniphilum sp. TaxID=1926877 RepID=UPI002B2088C5|nr:hypothetical protein [Proteiniphilum sp.]MEA4917266.1 hypothetical protein [Proteiniphilum sp.]
MKRNLQKPGNDENLTLRKRDIPFITFGANTRRRIPTATSTPSSVIIIKKYRESKLLTVTKNGSSSLLVVIPI